MGRAVRVGFLAMLSALVALVGLVLALVRRTDERVRDIPFSDAAANIRVGADWAARNGFAGEAVIGETEDFDRLFATFWISYGFYLVLGDPTYWFDLVTGAAVAGIVAVSLAQVTFTVPLDRVQSPIRVVRFAIYVPYLLWEIVKANIAVSAVILRPSMPIEPSLSRVNSRVRGGLPLTALANSITLTPGTLTVRATNQELLVHSLITDARDDLFDGGLERGIRFVFYGRDAAAIPSPRERDDAEVVGGEEL